MATNLKRLSDKDADVPSAQSMKFGIVVSQWNEQITEALFDGAYKTLIKHGAKEANILKIDVPGSFELTAGAKYIAEYTDVDVVICIGCVIQGETRHFDFICQGVTQGITKLNIQYDIPFIFCVLTTNTIKQADERAGGKHGNKGNESAIAAIKMVALKKRFT